MFNTKAYNEAMYNHSTIFLTSGSALGVGILDGNVNFIAQTSGSLSGLATLVGTPTKLLFTSASLSGIGSVTGSALKILYSASDMLGVGTSIGSVLKILYTSADMIGVGTSIGRGIVASFIIGTDGKLSPLGVFVLRDTREELLPGTRDKTETIPGRDGEIDFGTDFHSRILELEVVTPEGINKGVLKRQLAKYLNPKAGAKPLIFLDDMDKVYLVKYSGKIDLNQYPDWFSFPIPFKMHNPYILSTFEQEHSGNGTLTNEGTVEAPLTIEIDGPATNPSVTIGSDTLTYTGTLAVGDTLTIDTETMTVKFNSSNALKSYTGGFPKLQPGDTAVTAGSNVTFKWNHRWL